MKRILWVSGIVLLFCFSLTSKANAAVTDGTFVGQGCFVRTSDAITALYTVRMTAPSCVLTITNNTTVEQQVIVLLENIDPDYVMVDNYDTTAGLIKTDNTLQFQMNVLPGANTVHITPWYQYDDDFYFVALSDNQSQGTVEANPVFTQILRQVSVVNPAFFTNSGDVVQGSTDPAVMQQMYDAVLQELQAESTVPMYPIAGNHDVWTANIFQQNFGISDYAFNFGTTQFVGLNTAVEGKSKGAVTGDQLRWLDNTLGNSNVERSIMFLHHPLQVPAWGKSTCCYIDFENRNQLANVLDAHQVPLVLVGHSQGYDDDTLVNTDISTIEGGIRQLVIGGAGGRLKQPDAHHFFTLVHVSPTAITPTLVPYDSFATTVTTSTNDGSATTVTSEVVNAATTDLPYLRLKFKIANTYRNIVLFDNTGKYYTNYFKHVFPDYTVIYLDTTAPAQSDITYTLAPATQLHLASTNIITAAGEVAVTPTPISTQTLVQGLSVQPDQTTTTITNLQWGDSTTNYKRTWLEQPEDYRQATNYIINQLPAQRQFAVKVNGKLYQKVMSDITGTVVFSYTANKAKRKFNFSLLDSTYPHTAILTPASGGQPQVRIFDSAGKNLTNWYGLNKSSSGAYSSLVADVTGDGTAEVLLYTGSGPIGKFGIYTSGGEQLGLFTPYGNQFKAGLQLQVVNLTHDGVVEIVVAPAQGKGVVQVYQYNLTSQTFSLLTTKILSADITPLADKLAVVQSGKRNTTVRLYQYDNLQKKLIVVAKKVLVGAYATTNVVQGDILGVGKSQLVLYQANTTTEKITVLDVNAKNTLQAKGSWNISSGLQGNVQLKMANVVNQAQDTLLMWSNQQPYYLGFIKQPNGVTKIFTSYPFGKKFQAGLNISAIDTNNDGQVELVTAPKQGIPKIKVWYYNAGQAKLQQQSSWLGYQTSFKGGVNIGQ